MTKKTMTNNTPSTNNNNNSEQDQQVRFFKDHFGWHQEFYIKLKKMLNRTDSIVLHENIFDLFNIEPTEELRDMVTYDEPGIITESYKNDPPTVGKERAFLKDKCVKYYRKFANWCKRKDTLLVPVPPGTFFARVFPNDPALVQEIAYELH